MDATSPTATTTEKNLRAYLNQLSPAARAMLLRELECGSYTSELTQGLERVITELRSQLRGTGHSAERIEGPERRFFYPVEPFLIDEELPHKLTGRIHRGSLIPIWKLLSDVALPRETAAYVHDLTDALAVEDDAAAAQITARFHEEALRVLNEALEALDNDPKAYGHLSARFASDRVVDDLVDVTAILREQVAFACFANYLPLRIDDLGERDLANLRALFRQPMLSRPDVLPYALAIVISRLAHPDQIFRLVPVTVEFAARAPEEKSDVAIAVDLVIGEIARVVIRLQSDLRARRKDEALAEIKRFAELVHELNSAVDLHAHPAWSRWRNLICADFAVLIRSKFDALPGRILRILRPRTNGVGSVEVEIDATEVAEIESLLEILTASRGLAGELSLTDVVARLDEELESCLDTAMPHLLMSLPQSKPQHRPILLTQLDAAVRFAGQRSGKCYAEMLARIATEVAETNEIKFIPHAIERKNRIANLHPHTGA